jgi:hypothetical protein
MKEVWKKYFRVYLHSRCMKVCLSIRKKTRPTGYDSPQTLCLKRNPSYVGREKPWTPAPSIHSGTVAHVRLSWTLDLCFDVGKMRWFLLQRAKLYGGGESNSQPRTTLPPKLTLTCVLIHHARMILILRFNSHTSASLLPPQPSSSRPHSPPRGRGVVVGKMNSALGVGAGAGDWRKAKY